LQLFAITALMQCLVGCDEVHLDCKNTVW